MQESSLLGLCIERFRDYSGPCQTRAFLTVSTMQSAPGQRGKLCWTCSLILCSSQPCVCHTVSDTEHSSRKSQVPVHRPPIFPSAARVHRCVQHCNPNTTLHWFSKSCAVLTRQLRIFKKETHTQKYLIIRQLSCSSKYDSSVPQVISPCTFSI